MILFRADGNSEIGSGHIMRCLSLADAFRSIGKESVFVCSDDTMLEIIKRRGYLCHVLNSDYQNPEGETEALLGCDYYNQAQGIVVDSYFVNHKYMDSIRINKKTVYFDDLFRSFNADGVINYNIYADSAEYKTTRSHTKFFLGPGYAPLRSEFCNVTAPNIKDCAKNILILTGGADPYHIAYGFLKEINASNESSRVYHIVVGKMSPDFEQIKELSNRIENVVIYHNVEDMLSLMRQCDIAVSAAGSTLYELCACGIPTINYIFADNQIMGAKRFAEDNIMFSAGDVRDNKGFFHNLSEVINVLSESVDLRIEMSRAAQKMVDGRGALRLAKELEELFS